jgi:cysteine desulfurase family protein
MGREIIYLNNGATSLIKPACVYDAFLDAAKGLSNMGRGSSSLSIETMRRALAAREALAALFCIKSPLRIGFVKNATEALNAGIFGCLKTGDHVISTVGEHNSLLRPLMRVQDTRGVKVTLLPVDKDGRIFPDDFKKAIRKNTKMIAMSHVSNVTGNVFDIRAVGKIAREAGALFFLDAAQSAGVKDIDVERDNIDMMAFTAHKYLFAFQGLGGLYLREGVSMEPLILGGGSSGSFDVRPHLTMPELVEAGTQNMPGIAALDASVRFILENREAIAQKEDELTRYFLLRIAEEKSLTVLGEPSAQNRAALFSLVSRRYSILDLAAFLDENRGIETRLGGHCAPLLHRHLGSEKTGTLRISLCYFNEKREIDALMEGIRAFTGACGSP